MAKPKLTPAQIKARKTKRVAIVLVVVLAGVLAYEVPTMMKLMGGPSAPSAAAVGSSTTSTTAADGTSGAAAATPSSSGGTVPGAAPTVVAFVATPGPGGQLSALPHYATKDPFVVQVGEKTQQGQVSPDSPTTTTTSAAKTPAGQHATTTPTATTTTATTTTAPPASPPPATTTTATTTTAATTTTTPSIPVNAPGTAIPITGTTPPTVAATTTTTPVPFTTAPPNAALIEVNGKREVVALGQSFPTKAPLFKLVSLGTKHGTIRISVLGGSFVNGAPAMLLRHKQTLTLANESDGTRYVVKLLELTVAELDTTPSSGSAVAPAGTVPVTTSPTVPAGTTTTSP